VAAEWLGRRAGTERVLRIGTLCFAVFYAMLGAARPGWQFYAAYVVFTATLFGGCATSAQISLTMVEAARAGVAQGELQAGLSRLGAVGHICAPILLSGVYDLGVRFGVYGLFYYAIAAAHMSKHLLLVFSGPTAGACAHGPGVKPSGC
jgi:hypothetical protein